MRHHPRGAFTLVELLIVIAILAVLAAILLPALSRARAQVQQVGCASNERQIVMAMLMYADSNHGRLPVFTPTNPVLERGLGMAIWLESVGDAVPNYDFRNGALWPYTGTNDIGARQRLFNCPADVEPRLSNNDGDPQHYAVVPSPRNFTYTFNYELYQSGGSELYQPRHETVGLGVPLSRVPGTSHKVLVVEEEAPHFQLCDFAKDLLGGNNQPPNPLTTRHWGYANLGMADGHVEMVGPNNAPHSLCESLGRPSSVANATAEYMYYCVLPH